MSFTGTKRVIDLTSDCVEIDTKRTKTEEVKKEDSGTDTVSELDPILFIVFFDGEIHQRYGDHPSLAGVTGFQSGDDLSFYTDDMHRDVVKSLVSIGGGITEPEFTDDEKLTTLDELCTYDATPGKSYRATVVFTYPL